jgi:hypothetical protein
VRKADRLVLIYNQAESVVFIPGPRVARAGRTNRGGRNQVGGGQSGWASLEGGGIRDACQVAVGLLCVEWFARFSLSVCRRGIAQNQAIIPIHVVWMVFYLCTLSSVTNLCTLPSVTNLCTLPSVTNLCTLPSVTNLCTLPSVTKPVKLSCQFPCPLSSLYLNEVLFQKKVILSVLHQSVETLKLRVLRIKSNQTL